MESWNYNYIEESQKGGKKEPPQSPETTTGEWNKRYIWGYPGTFCKY